MMRSGFVAAILTLLSLPGLAADEGGPRATGCVIRVYPAELWLNGRYVEGDTKKALDTGSEVGRRGETTVRVELRKDGSIFGRPSKN